MNKKSVMRDFIKIIDDTGLMTKFIMNIFNYNRLNDYNYIFRLIDNDDEIIIDIYDNVSDTRFNRYIFNFINNDEIKEYKEDVVLVKKIFVLNMEDNNDKLLKLAYLFKLDKSKMIEYAYSFLDYDFVEILKNIIK